MLARTLTCKRWTPSFGQLSGQVKVDSRFMFLSRFRLR